MGSHTRNGNAETWSLGALMPDELQDSAPCGGIEGKYANYFQVGYNAFEFLLDFGQLYSDKNQKRYHTRIVTSPSYARELLKVLGASMERYEETFGRIEQQE